MNKFLSLLNGRFRYSVLVIFLLAAQPSCINTSVSEPYVSGNKAGPMEKKPRKQKKPEPIFKKKPGDSLADFQKDNRDGQLKLKQYGSPGPLTPYYNQLLTKDLGVKVEVIADGMISGAMLRYAKEYNAMMTREIEEKWGPGILQIARRKAQIALAEVEKDSAR